MAIPISNAHARRIFMERQGLSRPPQRSLGAAELYQLIHDLGFVQLDSIQWVERAHHHILFTRNQTYRPDHLSPLVERDRLLFEHWTHDASFIPSAFFPYWKHRFAREEARIRASWQKWQGDRFDEKSFEETLSHITERGPLLARDLKSDDHKSGGWWNWHPSKTALEFLWHTGRLAISARENFQKVYDLSERVIPAEHHGAEVDQVTFVDWACREALKRLGFATHGELAAFFDLVTPEEAKQWVSDHRDELAEVLIETVDGKPRASFSFVADLDRLLDAPEPPARVRTLSPFDPLIRDRNRTERLFGFFYRIEIYVPEPKRQYGYYVFPMLEGDRIIGRVDMKADRKAGVLDVRRLWLETGVRASSGRIEKVEGELARVARFAGLDSVRLQDGWLG
ncbi:winged helix-turn-helix domain-containing protein [Ciceribacter sp. L1K22]|uniref:winged helix-turn-helix domain-containing protein n=1 Tax=Ciceribacter sp. L1K22 TaxID=2820275 RepID=UPI001ABE483E|nr:winged helix-turn-helix domain-containing protein [Ciceribacter sp. L1K22]MBO3759135.1 YcaQ family DNA glycosylase [Ciceribacter sp. L1K22]